MPPANGHQRGEEKSLQPNYGGDKVSIDGVWEIVRHSVRTSDDELNLGLNPEYFTNYWLEDHLEGVSEEAVEVAQVLGLDEESIIVISIAGKLHDNSKTNPLFHSLWRLNRILTKDERDAMWEHAFVAATYLLICMNWVDAAGEALLWKTHPVVWHHHEWWMIDTDVERQRCMILYYVDRLYSRMEDRGDYHVGLPQDKALEWLVQEDSVPHTFREKYALEMRSVLDVIQWLYGKNENGQYRRTINLRRNKRM